MSEQYARKVDQHLRYAHSLVDSARRCSVGSHEERVQIQSALLQLNLAWSFYLWEMDARYGSKPSPVPQWLIGLPATSAWLHSAEGQEIAPLLQNPQSWLNSLREQLQSIWQVTKHTGLTGDLFAYQEQDSALISTTSHPDQEPITPALVQSWTDNFQGMVQRQRDNQEEY